MNIKIGDYKVLESGSFISVEGASVQFEFGVLKITFKFTTEDGGEMKVQKNVITSTEAELVFINFDAPLGCGNPIPYILGTYQGEELSLLVRFSHLERGGRTIHYTWLLKEKAVEDQKGERNE